LRQCTLWLQKEVSKLVAENAALKNTSEDVRQAWFDEKMRDQLSVLQKKFYGCRREAPESRQVGHEKEQPKLHGEYACDEKEKTEKSFICPIRYNYKMSDKELAKESLIRQINAKSEAWEEIPGLTQDSKEITIHEVVYEQLIHAQAKYRLKREYNRSGKEIIITTPGPVKIRPQSKYSVDFAINLALDKYGFHLPLERERRRMEKAGLGIDVKTLYGLCEAVAEHCQSVEKRIRQDIFNEFSAVHVDESTWPIHGQDSNGYMWTASNRRGASYRFEPSRSGKVAEKMLEGYEGAVLTDGFAGYNRLKKLPGLRMGTCWSHARREFFDRLQDYPVEAKKAVEIIDKLFAIEAKAKNFEQLKNFRREESKKYSKSIENGSSKQPEAILAIAEPEKRSIIL